MPPSTTRNLLQSLDGDWSGLAHSARVLRLSANAICQLSGGEHHDERQPNSPLHHAIGVTAMASKTSKYAQLLLLTHNHHHHNNATHTVAATSSQHTSVRKPLSGGQPHSFAQLHRLAWLDLSANRIADISAEAGHQQMLPPSLVTLDLSHNLLTVVSADLFARLPQLKFLLLAGNLLAENNGDASSIRTTTTASAALASPAPAVVRIHLEKLDLSDNRLESIRPMAQLLLMSLSLGVGPNNASAEHHPMRHAKAITLARNALRRVEADAFRHLRTQHLVLAFNRIEVRFSEHIMINCGIDGFTLSARSSTPMLFARWTPRSSTLTSSTISCPTPSPQPWPAYVTCSICTSRPTGCGTCTHCPALCSFCRWPATI